MRPVIGLLLCTLGGLPAGAAQAELAATDLTCEYLVNPLGIDVVRPRLSWIVPCDRRGQRQTAYRILVADSLDELNRDTGSVWDSGKVESGQTTLIEYAGRALGSRMRCFWKVKWWDKDGREQAWSESAYWSMGLLKPEDWSGQWIAAGGDRSKPSQSPSSLWLRKTFTLDGPLDHAEAYVATLGYHELYVNGRKVGDAVLSPAVCDYRHRALYLTYDIGPLLVPGRNCVALWLGRGWAAHKPYELPYGAMAQAQIEVTLAGGQTVRVATDPTWKSHPTPISYLGNWRFNDFGGERYDATLELPGWNSADLDDTAWAPTAAFDPPVGRLAAQMVQPDRRVETIRPVSVRELSPGVYVIDMGRNYTGWLEIPLDAPRGQTVQLDYSERPVDKPGVQTFRQFDQYVPRSDGRNVFCSRFNYHAFRWVTVSGLKQPPDLNRVRGHAIHSDYGRVGRFECSHELLNRIYETVLWTYRCLSLGGYVVDCPHRERLGYGAEGQVAVDTALYSFDQGPLFTKWLADWRDVQDPQSGEVPHTAPTYIGGGGPAWGGIVVTLPWQCYVQYGDKRILEDNYPMMQGYLRWLASKSRDHILQPFGGEWDFLADWVAPGRNVAPRWTFTPEPLRIFFNTCYWSYVTQLTARVADVLGKTDDAAAYREQAQRINRAAHAACFDATKATYVTGEQPYPALALLTETVPDQLRDKVLASLQQEILVTQKEHIDSGVLGTYFLLKFLTQANRSDLVYPLVSRRTYPSWGYMLDQGATTIWERWNGDESQNHTSFLSVGAWFVEGLAGIRADPASPGFQHVFVRPAVVGDLTFARASYRSLRGTVASGWQIEDGQFRLTVDVPAGSTATVYVPTQDRTAIRESGGPAEQAQGVRFLRRENRAAVYRVDSGRYTFQTPHDAGGD
ncbi:MAG: family 78 glycoside hydrolase catalytic domain [Candidatus Anammoximicrobium sp.]|nr:family 78 glycoside hydrolase catalytic domain [Candidatus Anammoximicrobium sp.]